MDFCSHKEISVCSGSTYGWTALSTAMLKPQLDSVYANTLDFEPDERRQRIMPDGTIELAVTRSPYMMHAKINLPLYGNIWVMTGNKGEGYTGDFVDFISEAARTYLKEAKTLNENSAGDYQSPARNKHQIAT